jgi:hypothetical protein
MRRMPADQCRRCGQRHEELFQLVDTEGRWAMTSIACACGHTWTIIHTAPANLAVLRAWMSRGCEPAEGPTAPLRSGPWQEYRLEGVCPAVFTLQPARGVSFS